jgi:GGDEF domain-containing protein
MTLFIASENGQRTFWRYSLIGALVMTVVLALGSASDRIVALICVTVLPLAWLVARRWPQIGLMLHLTAVLLWTGWHVRQPDAFHIRSGLSPFEAFIPIAMLIACGSAIFWGWRGGLAAVTLGIVLTPTTNPAQQAITGGMLFLIVMVGVIVHHLIGQLEQTRAELLDTSRRDPLTHLGNRHAFYEDIKTIRVNQTLVLWDLDGLKQINDRDGHAAGDQYILDFVAALRASTYPSNNLYRIGGDEFVSLHDTNALEVICAVQQRFPTVSTGTAVLGQGRLEHVMHRADTALYVQKRLRARLHLSQPT